MQLVCRELVLDGDDHHLARVLIQELAQLVDDVAEQNRAELAELVAEVEFVAGCVGGRRARLRTQVQRVLRGHVSGRLHHSAQPAIGQLGVDDLLVPGHAWRSHERIDQEAAYAGLQLGRDAPFLTGVEEAVLGVVHGVVSRGQRDLVEAEVAEQQPTHCTRA